MQLGVLRERSAAKKECRVAVGCSYVGLAEGLGPKLFEPWVLDASARPEG